MSSNAIGSRALRLKRNAQLIVACSGEIYARVESTFFLLPGLRPNVVHDVMELADRGLSVDGIERQLVDHDSAFVRQVITALFATGVLENIGTSTPACAQTSCDIVDSACDGRDGSVAILGNHVLLDVLARVFAVAGIQQQAFFLQNFESCKTEAFQTLDRELVLWGSAGADDLSPVGDYTILDPVAVASLCRLFERFSYVVCALEGVPMSALFDVNRAALETGTPCLFVTASAEEAVIGPTVIRGVTACYNCRALQDIPTAIRQASLCLSTPVLPSGDMPLAPLVAQACINETMSILGQPQNTTRAASVLRITAEGNHIVNSLLPSGECSACASITDENRTLLAHAATFHLAEEISRVWQVSPVAPARLAVDSYRRVGILGGGTAGYLTALALRAQIPELDVTLIESSKIPIIGVGEATTPELVKFLYSPRFLGRDIVDLHERVRPTLKLGIKFQWGLPGDYDFTYPFQRGRLLESHVYESTLNQQSMGAILMAADRVPIFKHRDKVVSLLHLVRWAYHLDNERFVRYLHEEAIAAGVHRIDATVCDADVSPDGETILSLVTDNGQKLEYDLYVDCSGFRSFLLEQKLGSKFISYASTLFTDRAIAASVPHDGTVRPYTLAETMNSGWCWKIPFENADHRGYVFSSAFSSVDQAADEMRASNPGMQEPRLVKFRSGRHEHFWKGNVVALGNSYAFVEPLESTALHMLVLQLELLTTHFPMSRCDEAVKHTLNRKINARWDGLRWFLGIHYKFNRRLRSPFWRAANMETDISGAEERVALFRERAPLSYRTSMFYTVYPPEFFSDDHAYDTLLLGQQVSERYVGPVEDRETWRRTAALLKRTAADALGQHEVLPYLRGKGSDLLYDFAHREDSWLHTWLPA